MSIQFPQTERLPRGGDDVWDQPQASVVLADDALPVDTSGGYTAMYLESGGLKFTGLVSGKVFLAVGAAGIEAKISNTGGYRKVALSSGVLAAL